MHDIIPQVWAKYSILFGSCPNPPQLQKSIGSSLMYHPSILFGPLHSWWSVAMQFAPAKVSIMQLVLSFLRSESDAVTANQYSAAYIFALPTLIVEADSKIKSCISLLNNT